MWHDKMIGVNRKMERMAWKILGALFAFGVTLYYAAISNVFN